MDIDDPIDLNGNIILGHALLGWNLNNLLTEVMCCIDSLNEWDLEIDTRLQLFVELLEAMEHHSILLTNDDHEAKVDELKGPSQSSSTIAV